MGLVTRTGDRNGGEVGVPTWTPALVEAALVITWRVVEQLEGERPSRVRCAWPATAAERWDYPSDLERVAPEPASPEEVDLADQVLPAIAGALEHRDRTVVAMRLARRSWRAIAEVDGRGKSWLQGSVWRVCLIRLGRHLDARGVRVPDWLQEQEEKNRDEG